MRKFSHLYENPLATLYELCRWLVLRNSGKGFPDLSSDSFSWYLVQFLSYFIGNFSICPLQLVLRSLALTNISLTEQRWYLSRLGNASKIYNRCVRPLGNLHYLRDSYIPHSSCLHNSAPVNFWQRDSCSLIQLSSFVPTYQCKTSKGSLYFSLYSFEYVIASFPPIKGNLERCCTRFLES